MVFSEVYELKSNNKYALDIKQRREKSSGWLNKVGSILNI